MKFEDISKVSLLQDELKKLIFEKELVERGNRGGLGITIQGSYQDDDFQDAVRPAVVAELVRRCEAIKSEMMKLGVIFD